MFLKLFFNIVAINRNWHKRKFVLKVKCEKHEFFFSLEIIASIIIVFSGRNKTKNGFTIWVAHKKGHETQFT